MSTHILTRGDGKHYYLTLSGEELSHIESLIRQHESLNVKGDIFPGKGCKLDQLGGDNDINTGSRITMLAYDVFRLPAGEKSVGFWQRVFQLNGERKRIAKPWLFENVIIWAKENTSFTRPEDLVEFIDSEWEIAKEHNVITAPIDHEALRMIEEYLATEPGKVYIRKMNLFSS